MIEIGDRFEIDIGCFLVSHGMPQALLIIQFRMIGRQIMDMQERMLNNKLRHPCTFMPSRIVHPKINGLSLEAIKNLPQNLNKSIGIAADPFRDSMRSLDEIDPSKDIQPLLMLTPGIDKRSASLFAHILPSFGCRENPVSSSKRTTRLLLLSKAVRSFF